MTRARGAVVLLACSLSLACAGSPPASPRHPDLISREELLADPIASLSAYEAIQRLRPNWLRARGASSIVAGGNVFPAVAVGTTIYRDLDTLRTIRAADMASVSFVDPRDATTRFGTGFVNGLIEVTLLAGPR